MKNNKKYKKVFRNKSYLKALSLLLAFNLSFSVSLAFEGFKVAENKGLFDSKKAGQVEKEDIKINKELKAKLDLLRVDQVSSSVELFDESSSVISENEWKELELDKVLENWDKYKKTKFDIWGVKNLLKYAPVGSKELIRKLVEDDRAFYELNKTMDIVEVAQDKLISYWDEFDELNKDSKELYFSLLSKFAPKANNYLNNNETILGALHSFEYVRPFVNIFAILGLNGVLSSYLTSKAAKFFGFKFIFPGFKKSFIHGLCEPFRAHNIFPGANKDRYFGFTIFDVNNITFGDKYVIGKELFAPYVGHFFENNKVKSAFAVAVSVSALVCWQAWIDYRYYADLRDSIKKIAFLREIAGKLQENLVKVADMLRVLNNLQDSCLAEGKKECFAIQNITKFLKRDSSVGGNKKLEGLDKLLDNLACDTFKNKSSVYNSGRLLITHKLMNELKGEIVPLLQNVALLGGYRMIAQIVREHKNSRTKFCFVDFIDRKTQEIKSPVIKMENAWVPLINEEKVVTNNFSFGVNCAARNAVVTGPNGGGKSTFMITAAFNVLLSKLGIAAADNAIMTDFEKIRISLRPLQDMASGLSSFMAEHKRVTEVKDEINFCNGNIFVLLDEPYKGTADVESDIRVYEFGKYVAENCPNCILLMATHLRRPIDLEIDTNGLFKNYQMGYVENGVCDFDRTFKVQDGPAIWWFDDASKRSRFIDWLCENEICV